MAKQIDFDDAVEISDLDYIKEFLMTEWITMFERKNRDYGDSHSNLSLGPKAVFVDVWRKACKLKRSVWEGHDLNYEQPREIMMDMIGHLFLMIAQTDKKYGGNIRPPRPSQLGTGYPIPPVNEEHTREVHP